MCTYRNTQSRTSFLIAMTSLLIFNLLVIPTRLYPHFHPDFMDGVRGLFLGIAIGCLGLFTWKNQRRMAQ